MTNAEHKLEYLCSVLNRCGFTLGQHMDQDYLECHEQNITQIVEQYCQPEPELNINLQSESEPLEPLESLEFLESMKARADALEALIEDVRSLIKQMKIWRPSDF